MCESLMSSLAPQRLLIIPAGRQQSCWIAAVSPAPLTTGVCSSLPLQVGTWRPVVGRAWGPWPPSTAPRRT